MNSSTCLVKLGFKEIEVGFPAASQIEYDFLRQLVDRKMIPDDVRIQVLVQCREHLIRRTFEAIEGIKKVVVHIYNSTSTLQRDVVFHKDKEEIKQIAIEGTELVKKYAAGYDGDLMFEYSPESFTGTELEYALDICTAVQDAWGQGDAGEADHHQSAVHGGDEYTECIRRPDRVDGPSFQRP